MIIMRVMTLGLAALLLSAATEKPATFCERLAPQLNMAPVASRQQATREWKVNLLSGLGPALFGGWTTASFAVRPIDSVSGEDYRRLEDSCNSTAKGAICDLEGPARLTVGTKKGEVTADLPAGERAIVEMRKTTIYCREER
jgi:hypothetical protein